MTGLADTVPTDRHPKSCSRWFASDATTGEAICDCGLAEETTPEGLYQHDLGVILRALGVGDFARSESAHMVVHDAIVPAIRAALAAQVPAHPDDGHEHSWGCRRCGVDQPPRHPYRPEEDDGRQEWEVPRHD